MSTYLSSNGFWFAQYQFQGETLVGVRTGDDIRNKCGWHYFVAGQIDCALPQIDSDVEGCAGANGLGGSTVCAEIIR